MSPFTLPNAQVIYIFHTFYYLLWTNKCHTLIFNGLKGIDSKWCQYIIDNCDCTGVKKVVFDGITFCNVMSGLENSTKLLLEKFAEKFKNLKHVVIRHSSLDRGYHNPCLVELMWYLSKIIKKNKTRVALSIMSNTKDCDKLVKVFRETRIMIDGLKIWMYGMMEVDIVKPLISNNNHLEYLV